MPQKHLHVLDPISTIETRLNDLLEDPMVQMVMQCDGIVREDIADLFAGVRKRMIAERWRRAA